MSPGLNAFGLAAVEAADDGLPLAASDPSMVVGTYGATHRLWRYAAGTWTEVLDVGASHAIAQLRRNPAGLIVASAQAASGPNTIRYSTDDGVTWLTGGDFGTLGDHPFGLDENGRLYRQDATAPARYSDDFGATWQTYSTATTGVTVTRNFWASAGFVYRQYRSTAFHEAGLYQNDARLLSISQTTAWDFIPTGTYFDWRLWVYAQPSGPIFAINRTFEPTGLVAAVTDPDPARDIVCLVPVDADTAYLCRAVVSPQEGWVYRTDDAGATWTLVLHDARLFPTESSAPGTAAIAFGPANHRCVSVVATGGIFHSSDAGGSWRFIHGPAGDEDFSCLALLPDATFPGEARYPAAGAAESWGPAL